VEEEEESVIKVGRGGPPIKWLTHRGVNTSFIYIVYWNYTSFRARCFRRPTSNPSMWLLACASFPFYIGGGSRRTRSTVESCFVNDRGVFFFIKKISPRPEHCREKGALCVCEEVWEVILTSFLLMDVAHWERLPPLPRVPGVRSGGTRSALVATGITSSFSVSGLEPCGLLIISPPNGNVMLAGSKVRPGHGPAGVLGAFRQAPALLPRLVRIQPTQGDVGFRFVSFLQSGWGESRREVSSPRKSSRALAPIKSFVTGGLSSVAGRCRSRDGSLDKASTTKRKGRRGRQMGRWASHDAAGRKACLQSANMPMYAPTCMHTRMHTDTRQTHYVDRNLMGGGKGGDEERGESGRIHENVRSLVHTHPPTHSPAPALAYAYGLTKAAIYNGQGGYLRQWMSPPDRTPNRKHDRVHARTRQARAQQHACKRAR